MSEKLNGWMSLFRIVTPALLGVLIWIVTNGNSHSEGQMSRIERRIDALQSDLTTLSNDYFHELISIRERLSGMESRMKK